MRIKTSILEKLMLYVIIMLTSYNTFGKEPIIVNEKFENISLLEVIEVLKREYHLKIAFEKKLVKTININQEINQLPLKEAWEKILKDTGLTFKIIGEDRVVIRKKNEMKHLNHHTENPTYTLTGVVKDSETGETLPFTSVSLKGTSTGVIANQDGYFTLADLPKMADSIEIKHLGYEPISVDIESLDGEDLIVIEVKPNLAVLEEVEVNEQNKAMLDVAENPGQFTLNPTQISNLPQIGENDLMRGIQMLPGISSTGEKASSMNIRGGSPNQNLVLFDGFTIYHLDHFYGLFSSFNTDAVKDIQVYRGGFDAKYGGRVSGLVDITGKAGNSNKPAASIGLNMLSANLAVETPVGDKATFFLSGRRAYTDIVQTDLYNKLFNYARQNNPQLNANTRQNENRIESPKYYYYDINTKVSFKPTSKDLISLSFYNGQDDYASTTNFSVENRLGSYQEQTLEKYLVGNTGLGLRWNRVYNQKLFGTLNLALSKYFRDYSLERYSETNILRQREERYWAIQRENQIDEISGRFNFEYTVNDKNYLEFGLFTTFNKIDYSDKATDNLNLVNFYAEGSQIGGFIQNTFSPSDKVSFTLGLRETYYTLTNEFYPEPRFSLSYQPDENWRFKGAIGRYYQYINQIEHSATSIINQDYWVLANDKNIQVLSSDHFIVGGSYEKENFLIDVEFYYKNLDGLITTVLDNVTRGNDLKPSWRVKDVLFNGEGYVNGVDVLIYKKGKIYSPSVGYTLSQVKHQYNNLNGGQYFFANNDQRHQFKFYNQFKLGKWDLSANWVFHTGQPYSIPSDTVTQANGNVKFTYDSRNNGRLPGYHRLDLSASYNFKLGKSLGKIGVSVFNAYDQDNIGSREYVLDRYGVFQEGQQNVNIQNVTTYDELLLGRTTSLFLNFQF